MHARPVRRCRSWPTVLLLALAACASRPETPALTAYDPDAGYRYGNLVAGDGDVGNADDLFVILTISGGGMRSAAFGYGVMERLRKIRIEWNGQERSLLDEVDVIAGVSSGALLAAYYAAYGEAVFDAFPESLLYRDIGRDLTWKLLSPPNLVRVMSPVFSRSDLVAEYYDETIFRGATYGDLLSEGHRPLLVIGGTDLGQGWSFPFTQARFDVICADLSGFPLARAVAASSAFPGVFSAITLENRAGSCGRTPHPGAGMWGRVVDVGRRLRERRLAEVLSAYADAEAHPHILVSDGGATDNIGLRTALEALESGQAGWRLSEQLRDGGVRKLVVITADAAVKSSCVDEHDPAGTGIWCELYAAANAPIDDRSLDTWPVLRQLLDRAGYPNGPPQTHFIYVGFAAIPDRERRRRFYAIPTALALPRQDADALRAVAGELLDRSPDMNVLRGGTNDGGGAAARQTAGPATDTGT